MWLSCDFISVYRTTLICLLNLLCKHVSWMGTFINRKHKWLFHLHDCKMTLQKSKHVRNVCIGCKLQKYPCIRWILLYEISSRRITAVCLYKNMLNICSWLAPLVIIWHNQWQHLFSDNTINCQNYVWNIFTPGSSFTIIP